MTGDADRPADLTGLRILVLEDDYYLAVDLCTILARWGAEVIGPFRDAADAMAAAARTRPDLAFLDINLGDGRSFEVPRDLARLGVPFAFVTGYDAATVPAGFAGVPWLEKPIAAQTLIDAMRILLRPGGN